MTESMTSSVTPGGYLDLVQAGLDANLPAPANVRNGHSRTQFYYATDTNILYKYNPTTNVWDSTAPLAVDVTANASARAISGVLYTFDAVAGVSLTLPGATGSGLIIETAVKTTLTSGSYKVLTNPTTDKLIGNVTGQTGNAVKQFSAAVAAGYHSLQMPFAGTQPSGGFEGDWFTLQDMAAGVWLVSGMFQAGTTPTTPFSTSTT